MFCAVPDRFQHDHRRQQLHDSSDRGSDRGAEIVHSQQRQDKTAAETPIDLRQHRQPLTANDIKPAPAGWTGDREVAPDQPQQDTKRERVERQTGRAPQAVGRAVEFDRDRPEHLEESKGNRRWRTAQVRHHLTARLRNRQTAQPRGANLKPHRAGQTGQRRCHP